MFDYFWHRFDKENFRIIMTILVKNEDDIIEQNIRVHASLGVDAFVVMDNDSTDNTKEILHRLQKEFEIVVIEEKGLYNQAKWMKQLAFQAKKLGADWVINNDADEFWIPDENKSLRNILEYKGSVITAHRYNMLIDSKTYQKDFKFYDMHYRVQNPIYYDKNYQQNNEEVSIILAKNAPKVITNPHGLILIRGGNHKALHIANMRDYFKHYDKIKRSPDITVYHYPIRSFEQFKKNIQNRKMLLESKKHIRMGPHYRRWVRLLNEGKLEEEFQKFILKPQEIETFLDYGIVVEDRHPQNQIKKVITSL